MSDFSRVLPGDRLRIPAAAYNAMLDAAEAHRGGALIGDTADHQALKRSSGIVLVRNDSGGDVEQFSVLGIDGPAITPDDNPQEFAASVLLKGAVPAEEHMPARFVITLEPIAANRIGLAMAAGVCAVKIVVPHGTEDLPSASLKPGDVTALSALDEEQEPSVSVLWLGPASEPEPFNPEHPEAELEDAPSTRWALVRIDASASGGGGVEFGRPTLAAAEHPTIGDWIELWLCDVLGQYILDDNGERIVVNVECNAAGREVFLPAHEYTVLAWFRYPQPRGNYVGAIMGKIDENLPMAGYKPLASAYSIFQNEALPLAKNATGSVTNDEHVFVTGNMYLTNGSGASGAGGWRWAPWIVLKVQDDKTWIEIDRSSMLWKHIGPDTEGPQSELTFDAVMGATPAGLQVAPVTIQYDARGHISDTSIGEVEVISLGSQLSIQAEAPWLTIEWVVTAEGTPAHMVIKHTGPGDIAGGLGVMTGFILEPTEETGGGLVFGSSTIHYDGRGHIIDTAAGGSASFTGDEVWISIQASEAPEEYDSEYKIRHIGPSQTTDTHYPIEGPIIETDPATAQKSLVISQDPLTFDEKGHYTAEHEPVSDGVPLIPVVVITDMRVSGTAIQVKTTVVWVLAKDDETDWITIHTGTECPPE